MYGWASYVSIYDLVELHMYGCISHQTNFQFLRFGFIEWFATTFLHTLGYTGSMRMIGDDDVGLKEKPEDARYIKRLHQNETWSTTSVGKLKRMDMFFCHYWELQTPEWVGFVTPWRTLGGYEMHTQEFQLLHDCWLMWRPQSKDCILFPIVCMWWGRSIITKILHGYLFTSTSIQRQVILHRSSSHSISS